MNDLDRFVRHLVETLQARSPDSVHRPLAVDDLRRTVLPYRVHRNALGLVSAEDYEMLVLRLAAEEGDYARTFPPDAAERFREEAASPNPDLAILEELAEATVAMDAAAVLRVLALEDEALPVVPDLPLLSEPDQESAAAGDPARSGEALPPPASRQPDTRVPGAQERAAASRSDPAPATDVPRRPAAPPPAPPGRVPAAPSSAPPPAAQLPGQSAPASGPPPAPSAERSPAIRARCLFCAAPLPAGKTVVFCPFCGQQLSPTSCPRCGAELEPGWRHCITCGHPMGPPRATA